MDAPEPRVLVVDDDPINTAILAEVLRPHCRVLEARGGAEALRIATGAEAPDMILLDINMPGMTGHEVCARLKSDPSTSGIPVIFVTSCDDDEDEQRGLELGAVDYLTKPVNPAIVLARVRTQLVLKRKIDLLERMAFLDGLTELPNRRAFDEAFEREWREANRSRTPLALLLGDIDLFKKVNDTHGHVAGDECLVRVGRALRSALRRPRDAVARVGGEEFAALLPDTDLEGAALLGETMRAAVEALEIPLPFSKTVLVVTISMGCATALPRGPEGREVLYDATDSALYAAKGGGRNRVCRAPG